MFKKYRSSSYKSKNLFTLIIFFLIIASVKLFLSFEFNTPWIFADEVVYDEIAQNVLNGNFYSELLYCQTYPPGYSLILSFAYMLSENKDVVYHLMLGINCFLTSSIVFPAYFILKKYCSEKFSLLGSLTIALLPSVTLYSFVLMSENLFIPLTVYSVWFVLESFEHNHNKVWDILAGFSIFYLYFTRTMGIAMVLAFFVAFTYNIWKKSKNESSLAIIKEKYLLFISLLLPLILWISYNKIFASTSGNYENGLYLSTLLDAFTTFQSFKTIILLSLHEIEYLILSSYFIIFFLMLLFIGGKFRQKKDKINIDNKSRNENIALKSSIVFSLVFSSIIILITIVHMQIYFMEGDPYYQIFGRYIDPIVPIIFLYGIMEIYNISEYNLRKQTTIKVMPVYIFTCLIFMFTFPVEYYKFPCMFSIFYIHQIKTILAPHFFLVVFPILILISFYFFSQTRDRNRIFLLFLIILSVSLSTYSFQTELNISSHYADLNDIGQYLQKNSYKDTLILMDEENFNQEGGPQMWFLTKYWTQGTLLRSSVDIISSGNKDDRENVDYIISKKLLPYQCVSCSETGYKLYKPVSINKLQPELPYFVDIGLNDECLTENFYYAENSQTRWSKNSSKVLLNVDRDVGDLKITIKMNAQRPTNDPANVKVYLNNKIITEMTKSNDSFEYTYQVSHNYLNENYQILEIATNTWNPTDYGSVDNRDLGVQVDWIKVDNQ